MRTTKLKTILPVAAGALAAVLAYAAFKPDTFSPLAQRHRHRAAGPGVRPDQRHGGQAAEGVNTVFKIANKITPLLWYDSQARDAAALYIRIFGNGHIVHQRHRGEGTPYPDCIEVGIADQAGAVQPALQRIRASVREKAPAAEEAIRCRRRWRPLAAGRASCPALWPIPCSTRPLAAWPGRS